MDNLKPNAKEFYNPSPEYISGLIAIIQNKTGFSLAKIDYMLGLSRGTLRNYMRDPQTDERYRPHPYTVQFTLEELIKNLQAAKDKSK